MIEFSNISFVQLHAMHLIILINVDEVTVNPIHKFDGLGRVISLEIEFDSEDMAEKWK